MSTEQGKRVDLGGALEGHYVRIDLDELDCGLFEDMESGKASVTLDALARCLKGGDLKHGTDRAGLRKLKPAELVAVLVAVKESVEIPKPA